MRLLTKREAAAQLRISTRTLDRMIHIGQISAPKIGGQIRIREDEIARLAGADPRLEAVENLTKSALREILSDLALEGAV